MSYVFVTDTAIIFMKIIILSFNDHMQCPRQYIGYFKKFMSMKRCGFCGYKLRVTGRDCEIMRFCYLSKDKLIGYLTYFTIEKHKWAE